MSYARGMVSLPIVSGSARGAARLATAPLETCEQDDQLHDYILDRYTPALPIAGKLRSVNFLVESFALAGVEGEGAELVRRIREGYGPFRTVWGVKLEPATGRLAWELYFYDFDRRHADCSIDNVRRLLDPVLAIDASEPRPLPWHMFSVGFDADELRGRGPIAVRVYIDMRSYELRGEKMTLENVYTFHEPRLEIEAVLHRLRSSVHVTAAGMVLAEILPPPLLRCHRVCVANKRGADAVYFSRIDLAALRFFLQARGWPEPLTRFVTERKAGLDHLRWCVGIDFKGGAEGAVELGKSGIYGSF